MHPNLPIDHLLDEYLQGSLSKDVLKNQAASLSEEALEQEIELHRAAQLFLQKAPVMFQVNQLHEQFLKENRQEEKPPVTKIRSLVKWITVAASIIVLAGIFYWQFPPTDSNALYSAIYQPYKTPVYRSGNTISPLASLYGAKKYRELLSLYEKNSTPDNQEKLLAGLSYASLEEWNQAAHAFQSILDANKNNEAPVFQDEAEFYGGLAYLKTGALDKSLALFSSIRADAQHLYHQQVTAAQLSRLEELLRK